MVVTTKLLQDWSQFWALAHIGENMDEFATNRLAFDWFCLPDLDAKVEFDWPESHVLIVNVFSCETHHFEKYDTCELVRLLHDPVNVWAKHRHQSVIQKNLKNTWSKLTTESASLKLTDDSSSRLTEICCKRHWTSSLALTTFLLISYSATYKILSSVCGLSSLNWSMISWDSMKMTWAN